MTETRETVALFPASFDPPTNGHLDIIRRACRLFDKVIVAIVHNPEKSSVFSHQDRSIMIEEATRIAFELGLDKDHYEFAMLFGIQRDEQERLAQEGHQIRVLISYGSAWFPWYMRRLAERPANLWFVAKQLVG